MHHVSRAFGVKAAIRQRNVRALAVIMEDVTIALTDTGVLYAKTTVVLSVNMENAINQVDNVGTAQMGLGDCSARRNATRTVFQVSAIVLMVIVTLVMKRCGDHFVMQHVLATIVKVAIRRPVTVVYVISVFGDLLAITNVHPGAKVSVMFMMEHVDNVQQVYGVNHVS